MNTNGLLEGKEFRPRAFLVWAADMNCEDLCFDMKGKPLTKKQLKRVMKVLRGKG